MVFAHRIFETEFAGRTMSFEVGKIGMLANGACIVRYGETTVMVNVTMSKKPREGIDFFPMSVDFEEKLYAAGKNSRLLPAPGRPSLRPGDSGFPLGGPADAPPLPQGPEKRCHHHYDGAFLRPRLLA